MAGSYKVDMNPADGTGNWSITIPTDASRHDVLALGPVIQGVKAFLQPTIAVPDEPIGYQLVDTAEAEPPNLIA